jgi:hypothetical protein
MLPVAAVHPPVTVVPHLPTLAQPVLARSGRPPRTENSYFQPELCHYMCNTATT